MLPVVKMMAAGSEAQRGRGGEGKREGETRRGGEGEISLSAATGLSPCLLVSLSPPLPPCPSPAPSAELAERRAAPKPAPADRHVPAGLGIPAAKQGTNRLGQRDGDEPFGLGLGEAADQAAPAHARIDQNRHGAGLEQAEHQRNEIDPRRNQQRQPAARCDAHCQEPAGDPIAIVVQLAKRDLPVRPPTVGAAAGRLDDRHGVGALVGHQGKSSSHVEHSGGLGIWGFRDWRSAARDTGHQVRSTQYGVRSTEYAECAERVVTPYSVLPA